MHSIIRTVLGDISPENLGITYMHEHLIIESEIVKKDFEHIYLSFFHVLLIYNNYYNRHYNLY